MAFLPKEFSEHPSSEGKIANANHQPGIQQEPNFNVPVCFCPLFGTHDFPEVSTL